jgi:hypothetical protein
MTKALLAAVMALTLTSGISLARSTSSSSTSTETTTAAPAPVQPYSVDSSSHRTTDRDGVTIDKEMNRSSGKTVSPDGTTTATTKSSETTTKQ